MKIRKIAITASILAAFAVSAQAATITVNYTTDASYGGDVGINGDDLIWNVTAGKTVSGTGRFFVGMVGTVPSSFTLTGGGTVLSNSNSTTHALRIGWSNLACTVNIEDGSTFMFSDVTAKVHRQTTGSAMNLLGAGSTFSAAGTYSVIDATSGSFQGVGGGVAIPVSADGTIQVTDLGGGFTQISVVPEPSSTALLGLGGLALILRRRK